MSKSKVREDARGVHVLANDWPYRPGAVSPHCIRRRMDDGGLEAGMSVQVALDAAKDLAEIRLDDGTVTFWHADGIAREKGLTVPPEGAKWRSDGRRDYRGLIIG